MIGSVLRVINAVYSELYPKRNVGMINRHTHERIDHGNGEWTRAPMDDTGICFGVAMFVQDYLRLRGETCEIVFIYRRYDAEEGDGFEDVLVHGLLYKDGKFYDTRDNAGVDSFEDITYIREFDGLGVKEHYLSYPERGDTGSRDSVPNRMSDSLYSALEKSLNCTIPRRSIF